MDYESNEYGDNGDTENFDPNAYGEEGDDFDGFQDEEFVQLPGVDDLPLFSNPVAKKLDAEVKEKESLIDQLSNQIGKILYDLCVYICIIN